MKIVIQILVIIILNSAVYAETLKVAIISDLNSSYLNPNYTQSSISAIQYLKKFPDLDAILITGDLIPGQVTAKIRDKYPQRSHIEISDLWLSFQKNIYNPLRELNIPILITPGNHDAGFGKLIEDERSIYREMWKTFFKNQPKGQYLFSPEEEYNKNNFTYAFQLKGFTFISLDATTSVLSQNQINFYQAVRKKIDKNQFLVFGHLPFFPFSKGKKGKWEYLQSPVIYKLLERDKAPYFSGHTHVYYPGKIQSKFQLKKRKEFDWFHVSTGCLGTGQRYINHKKDRQKPSFSLIKFDSKDINHSLKIKSYQYTQNSFEIYNNDNLEADITRLNTKIININHSKNIKLR